MIVTLVVLVAPVCCTFAGVVTSLAVQCHECAAAGRVNTSGCDPVHVPEFVAVKYPVFVACVIDAVEQPPLASVGAVLLRKIFFEASALLVELKIPVTANPPDDADATIAPPTFKLVLLTPLISVLVLFVTNDQLVLFGVTLVL